MSAEPDANMLKTSPALILDSEIIALKVLSFIASDEDRMSHFLTATGLAPEAVRTLAGEPAFLCGLLDYLRADQSLLLIFAESADLDPAAIDIASLRLGGTPT